MLIFFVKFLHNSFSQFFFMYIYKCLKICQLDIINKRKKRFKENLVKDFSEREHNKKQQLWLQTI